MRTAIVAKSGAWVVLLSATSVFVLRGPWRALEDSGDFAATYSFARAWLKTQNPFDSDSARSMFVEGGGASILVPSPRHLPSVYLPTAFPVLAPFAILPWSVARVFFLVTGLACLAVATWALLDIAGTALGPIRRLVFVSCVLAFGPIHTSIAKGQATTLVFAAVALALVLLRRERALAAGFAVAVATALKPQLAAPILAYLLFRGGLRFWVAWGAALATLLVIALTWMGSVTDWFPQWLGNVRASSTAGAVNDSSPLNPLAYHLINLEPAISRHLPLGVSRAVVLLIVGAATIIAFAALKLGDRRADGSAVPLLVATSLVATYHRYYDGVLLLFVVIWCLSPETQLQRLSRWVFAGALGIMFVPGQAALHRVLGEKVGPTTLWRELAETHQMWAVFLIAAMLCLQVLSMLHPASAEGTE